MGQGTERPQPDADTLFKEYELCQESAQKLESTIWQTSAALGIGSIGTLSLIANHPLEEQPPFLITLVIGLLISGVGTIWWHMARRWWSIQHAKYLRMRHIEEELNMHQTRYIKYLDDPSELATSSLPKERQDELKRFADSNYQREGVQKYMKLLPLIMAASWGVYLWIRSVFVVGRIVQELIR